MRILASTLYLLLSAAAVTPAGCGGSQQPAGASGVAPATLQTTVRVDRDRSWILPEATTKDLLYVAGSRDNKLVYVFTYTGGKHVGTLDGLWDPGTAMCVDASQNVWISSGNPSEMLEYAHGKSKPIATLPDNYGLAIGCSVDPTTGDLAVANIFGSGSKPYTSIIVFQNAQGNPTVYTVDNFEYVQGCAYDGSGNLFASGWVYNKGTHMAELPAGGSQFVDLRLSGSFAAGWLQWQGTYLYVGVDYSHVYRLLVSGSQVRVKGKIQLNQADKTDVFFIDGGTVIAHVAPKTGTVGFWKFPKGGNPTKILPNAPREKGPTQNGIAVSLATSK
jgi:hypothetical protein